MSTVAMDTAYEDTQELVERLVGAFIRRFGGDWEDLLSEAQEAWVYAYNKHTPERGDFTKWVKFIVWKWLQERQRRNLMRNSRLRRESSYDLDFHGGEEQPKFAKHDLMCKLSEDAQTVVRLVVEVNKDIEIAVLAKGGVNPINYRSGIWEVCKDMGWTWSRLRRTFKEIKHAL